MRELDRDVELQLRRRRDLVRRLAIAQRDRASAASETSTSPGMLDDPGRAERLDERRALPSMIGGSAASSSISRSSIPHRRHGGQHVLHRVHRAGSSPSCVRRSVSTACSASAGIVGAPGEIGSAKDDARAARRGTEREPARCAEVQPDSLE